MKCTHQVLTGVTGFGVRDGTPEANRLQLHIEAPGVTMALLQEELKHTSLAVLSSPGYDFDYFRGYIIDKVTIYPCKNESKIKYFSIVLELGIKLLFILFQGV